MNWLAKAEVSSTRGKSVIAASHTLLLLPAQHQCRWTLNALMIEAIQRPPRYILLLQDLLNSTQRDHPDYHHLEMALEVVSGVGGGDTVGGVLCGATVSVCAPCQVTQECNQKTKSMQAELALLMIGKQFPYDEVVSQHLLQCTPHSCLTSILWHPSLCLSLHLMSQNLTNRKHEKPQKTSEHWSLCTHTD